MNTGEIIKKLVTAENYIEERIKVSDQFIDMIKTCLPSDYDYIKEKEDAYQELIKLLA